MSYRFRAAGAILCFVLGLACAQTHAANDVDTLARDVDRLVSLRQVKDLQRSYAQYAQSGQWDQMASLFATNATFIRGTEILNGRAAIEDWLTRSGGGQRGLPPGALHTEMIDEPLANLSVDGRSAKVRWMTLAFLADGKGGARIEGGIYENEYVREGQSESNSWKISVSHYYAQYSGSYEDGWINEGGADLPLIPYHFTVDESGVPVPPAAGPAPPSKESLASLMRKIDRLNDEDDVRNLQHAYGYYVDLEMWDHVVDLFTTDSTVEIKGVGTFRGPNGVRHVMERMGAAGLQHGQLNDHPLFDTMVQVLPGGREALSRGIDLGMIGEADKGTAHWELSVFRNRFVKENGLWKLKELHVYPIMNADYFKGWGSDGVLRNVSLPAMLRVTAEKSRTAHAATSTDTAQLADARRRLARSMAYDGTENVSSAYGYYIDDFQWPNMGAIFAEHGMKQSPFAGYYIGRERISKAATTMYGSTAPATRAGIAFHWRIQPVVNIAADGRSANLRTRLFHPDTGKQSAALGGRGGASIMSGMYPNDQTVLENGVWRLWSLEIDEPYFTMAGWKGGWSSVKDKPPGSPRPPLSPLVARLAPDILMTDLGRRAEHFRGGTGETLEWPGILPMWFNYRNPVSGRAPELYWPDCVPCELKPDSSMTKHGYQMPPTGPDR
ncbi:MAG: nuclear transport factor 2 family protein [Gammaproteobacteria bacterium]